MSTCIRNVNIHTGTHMYVSSLTFLHRLWEHTKHTVLQLSAFNLQCIVGSFSGYLQSIPQYELYITLIWKQLPWALESSLKSKRLQLLQWHTSRPGLADFWKLKLVTISLQMYWPRTHPSGLGSERRQLRRWFPMASHSTEPRQRCSPCQTSSQQLGNIFSRWWRQSKDTVFWPCILTNPLIHQPRNWPSIQLKLKLPGLSCSGLLWFVQCSLQ